MLGSICRMSAWGAGRLARFRAVYVALMRYNEVAAETHCVTSLTVGSPYAGWAAAFWTILEKTGDMDRACAANRDSVGELMMEGYNHATNPLQFRTKLCDL